VTETLPAATPAVSLRIGEVANRAGVTARTLRYWEEIGLIKPCSRRSNNERLYSSAEVERIERIRDLQDLLGFSLAEIRAVLDTDIVLERVRKAYRAGDRPDRRRQLLAEAIEANDILIARVDETIGRVQDFRLERVAKGERMRARAAELDAEEQAATTPSR
jgi:MerR family transcriptional regulator, repressor of the yfmOP operon